jgi:predicted dienelactone hydrolase
LGKVGVMVCSTTFTGLGRAQSKAMGYAQLPILVIPHPFGTRTREEIRGIAEKCAEQLMALVAEGQKP